MSINVYGTISCTWRLIALGTSIITDERDEDFSVSVLIFHRLEISAVWKFHIWGGLRIFVLGLKQNDWASPGNLGFGYDLANILHVIGGIIQVIRSSEPFFRSLQPARISTSRYFCIDIWSWPCKEVDSGFTGGLEERLQSKNPLSREVALLAL